MRNQSYYNKRSSFVTREAEDEKDDRIKEKVNEFINDDDVTEEEKISLLDDLKVSSSENNGDYNDKVDIQFSKEDMDFIAQKVRDGTNLPVYDTNSVFDNLKIIFSSIVADSKLKYRPFNYIIEVLKDFNKEIDKEDSVYGINNGWFIFKQNKEVVEHVNFLTTQKKYDKLTDYGDLLYLYGKFAIGFLAATVIKINNKGVNEPLNPDFESIYNLLYLKITNSDDDMNSLIPNNEEKLKTSILTSFRNHYTETMKMHQNIEENIENENSKGSILASAYLGMSILLTGVCLKYIETFGFNSNLLLSEDTVDENIKLFINNILNNTVIDVDSRNKFISMCITYSKITDFYSINTGYDFTDDPVIRMIYKIGEEFNNYDFNKLSETIDLSLLTQSDIENKYTLEALLNTDNFFSSPGTYISNSPSIFGQKMFIAFFIFKFIPIYESDYIFNESEYKEKSFNNLVSNFMKEAEINLKSVESFYNYFIDSIIKNIGYKINPKYFYFICISRFIFKYIINNSRSKEVLYISKLGIMEADSYIKTLVKIWSKNNLIFNTSETVQTPDNRAIVRKLTALTEIEFYIKNLLINDFESLSKKIDIEKYKYYNPFILNYEEFFKANVSNELIKSTNKRYDKKIFSTILFENRFFYKDSISIPGLDDELKNMKYNNLTDIFKDDFNSYERITCLLLDFFNSNNTFISIIEEFLTSLFSTSNYCINEYIARTLEKKYNEETNLLLEKLSIENNDKNYYYIIGSINDDNLINVIRNNVEEIHHSSKKDNFEILFYSLFRYNIFKILAKKEFYNGYDETDIMYNKESKIFADVNTEDEDYNEYLNLLPIINSVKNFTFMNIK